MAKIQLVLAVPDEDYLRLLSAYIYEGKAYSQINFRCFSQEKSFQQWAESEEAELLLIDETWLPLWQSRTHVLAKQVCVLHTQRTDVVFKSEDGMAYPAVFKYQSASNTINQLLSCVRMQPNRHKTAPHHQGAAYGRKPVVLALYSAIGSCGKTTLALNLAQMLAERNQQVLYISLERCSAFSRLFELQGRGDFSEILYYLNNRRDELDALLTGKIHQHEPLGFFYIHPLELDADFAEWTEPTIEEFVNALRKLEQMDIVILDLDAVFSARARGVLRAVDYFWWFILDDLHGICKTDRMLETWRSFNRTVQQAELDLGKIQFILNRSYGWHANDLSRFTPLAGELPYISEWKQMAHRDQLFQSALYRDGVQVLYQTLLEGEGVG